MLHGSLACIVHVVVAFRWQPLVLSPQYPTKQFCVSLQSEVDVMAVLCVPVLCLGCVASLLRFMGDCTVPRLWVCIRVLSALAGHMSLHVWCKGSGVNAAAATAC